MAFVLGLTGSFGSGKSTVAGMLAEAGAAVIDASEPSARSSSAESTGAARTVNARGPDIAPYERSARGAYFAY